MSNEAKTTIAAPVPPTVGRFKGAGQIMACTVSVFATTARTVDKTVGLVENEVDHLHILQQKRISDAREALQILVD